MGGGTRNQTTTQRQELPAWVNAAGEANYRLAEQIASRPYQAYSGDRVADFNGDQQFAFQRIRDQQGSGARMVGDAQAVAGNVAAFNPQQVNPWLFNAERIGAQAFTDANLAAYMNPYLSAVEDRALDALERQRQLGQRATSDAAIAAGAFGGSRQGVREAVIDAEAARAAADTSANIRAQGFQQAAQLIAQDQARALAAAQSNQSASLNADQMRLAAMQGNQQADMSAAGLRLNAANALGNLANLSSSLTAQEIAMLTESGAMQQALRQAQLDDAYQRFVEARDHDLQGLNIRSSSLAAAPYERTTTTTQPVTRPSPFMQAIGAAGSLASVAGLFMSDRDKKTDVERIGRDPDTGEMLYAYRYKGDPKTYPKVVGPMAQDIERDEPERIRKTRDGVRMVAPRGLMGEMG